MTIKFTHQFERRPDLSPFLIHLTKRSPECSAFENLVSILQNGRINGSKPGPAAKGTKPSYIKGSTPAACFLDVPLSSLKYVLNAKDSGTSRPRYEPYGVVVSKERAYRGGARPVLYLSDEELADLCIPTDEKWRVVRFELDSAGSWVSWLHEREWRCPGNFKLPSAVRAVLVKNLSDAKKLQATLLAQPDGFLSRPVAILPLTVVCQGLPYLDSMG